MITELTLAGRSREWFDQEYFGGGKSMWGDLESPMVIAALAAADRERAEIVAEAFPTGRILDVGAGRGGVVSKLRSCGREAYGLDWSHVAMKKRQSPYMMEASVWNLPFKDKSFAGICSFDLLEHLPIGRISRVLQEINRVSMDFLLWVGICFNHDIGDTTEVKGQDQSHVSVFTPEWWSRKLSEALPGQHPGFYPLVTALLEGPYTFGGLWISTRPYTELSALEAMMEKERGLFIKRFGETQDGVLCQPLSVCHQ